MSTRKGVKYSSWIFLNISFVVWLILFLMRISGKLTSWSWIKIFSPLYISFILLIFFVGSSALKSSKFEYFVWSTLSVCSLGIFVVLVSIKLNSLDDPNVNFFYVLIPLWVFLGLAMLLRNDSRDDNGKQKNYRTKGFKKNFRIFYPSFIVYLTIYTILELVSQTIHQLSWSIKFIPFFVFIGTNILVLLTKIKEPGFDMIITGLVCSFLLLLYLYLIDKIGHIAIPFIPVYIIVPFVFILGFFL
ncbi:hypothetical protein RB653_007004 [Dictyostelium firmibasis]|uniref:Uncharacterized protein n=1 Tax=Dictyostelium firmibasis TaxID=79012 RepID=A0AAN7YX56_9MYCE